MSKKKQIRIMNEENDGNEDYKLFIIFIIIEKVNNNLMYFLVILG